MSIFEKNSNSFVLSFDATDFNYLFNYYYDKIVVWIIIEERRNDKKNNIYIYYAI